MDPLVIRWTDNPANQSILTSSIIDVQFPAV